MYNSTNSNIEKKTIIIEKKNIIKPINNRAIMILEVEKTNCFVKSFNNNKVHVAAAGFKNHDLACHINGKQIPRL